MERLWSGAVEMRFGVGLWQGISFEDLPSVVRMAEDVGYDHVWYANHKLYRDAYMGLAVAAMSSTKVEIGSFVAEPYSYHPGQIAAAMASLDELSDGRAILGIGAGGGTLRDLGLERTRVTKTLRESIDVIHGLFRGDQVDVKGDAVELHGHLHVPVRPDLPVVLASRGDRVLALAGEIADGAMIATYATPPGLRHGLAMVNEGKGRSAKPDRPFRTMARVDVAIDEDLEVARSAVKPMIAMMVMASYPDSAFIRHAGLELTPALEAMARQKDETLALASGALIPDDFVRAFAWTGTVSDVAKQIAAIEGVGLSDLVILPQPLNESSVETIRMFATEVIPRVNAELGRPSGVSVS
jgi:5,10-methylenetetrahydromethanopterin reductase